MVSSQGGTVVLSRPVPHCSYWPPGSLKSLDVYNYLPYNIGLVCTGHLTTHVNVMLAIGLVYIPNGIILPTKCTTFDQVPHSTLHFRTRCHLGPQFAGWTQHFEAWSVQMCTPVPLLHCHHLELRTAPPPPRGAQGNRKSNSVVVNQTQGVLPVWHSWPGLSSCSTSTPFT